MRAGIVASLAILLTVSVRPARSDGVPPLDPTRGSLATDAPQPVYSDDPNDPWNRVFHALFTRPVEARVTSDFAGAGPFGGEETFGGKIAVSQGTIRRVESGDRGIEPLYPDWRFAPVRGPARPDVLEGRPRAALLAALAAVRDDRGRRTPLARALFQSDLWAAFDTVAARTPAEPAWVAARDEILAVLAPEIHRVALTADEIRALPDNLADARLPGRPGDPAAGWVEVEKLPTRAHDVFARNRRLARVFLKPAAAARDISAWLDGLQNNRAQKPVRAHLPEGVVAVALVVQEMLIDNTGRVVPSPLTSEVQVRTFTTRPGPGGPRPHTALFVAEWSRRVFLTDPRGGGLVRRDEDDPEYLPTAGNDYGFAPERTGRGDRHEPILVPLRRRCAACHNPDVDLVFTTQSLHDPEPILRRLDPTARERATRLASDKMGSTAFRDLMRRWGQ